MGHENLTAALCAFHEKVQPIHKDAKGQHSKYATLQAVLAAISPTLSECGLTISSTFTTDTTGRTLLCTHLRHKSGESISSSVPLVVEGGGRNPLHTWGGAVTYQRRYALLAILNLAAGIDDDDADSLGSVTTRSKPAAADDFF
jgi:hypothetical protein